MNRCNLKVLKSETDRGLSHGGALVVGASKREGAVMDVHNVPFRLGVFLKDLSVYRVILS